jgi:hypothetical protein
MDYDRRSARLKGLSRVLTFACSAALAACLGLLGPIPLASAREKTDLVILKNGDQLTGEVKGLQYARLEFKTDTMETVFIKWEEVERVQSKFSFQIELANGLRYFGTLGASAEPGMISVMGAERTVGLSLDQVVRIRPIKEKFWKRIDGSFSLGLSYTKASDVLRFSLNADAKYEERKNIVQTSLSSIVTTQKEEEAKQNNTLNLSYIRLLQRKWFLTAFASAQQNDELGINLRLLAGGGGGRLLVQTNRMMLPVVAGLVFNREWAGGDVGQDSYNLEAIVRAEWSVFIYHYPKTDVQFSLDTYPGLSDLGRVRLDFNSRLRREILKDFFVDLSLYLNFDNRPPSATASTTDYGFVTSVGYSF